MNESIRVIESEKRRDTTIIRFLSRAWTWAEFDEATSEAFKLAAFGWDFIISDLSNNGSYLPKGRTPLAAASAVSKALPETIRYWIIVGPPAVQFTLELTRKVFPKLRFVGAKNLDEAYAFIEKQQPSALVH
jgi:hypothetical protein